MITTINIRLLYGLTAAFAATVMVCLVMDMPWILLAPAVVMILFMAFFRLEKLVFLTVFLTPLSVNFQDTPIGVGISLPAEPVIFGLMLITFIKILQEGGFDRRILIYPVSLLILLHLGWFLFTTITSSMIVVSIKYTLARIWFVTAFFYLLSLMFRRIRNIERFVWCYTIPLLAVIVYTTVRHAAAGFTEKAAHISMTPFYNDHTAYAAALAMILPVITSFMFLPGKSLRYRIVTFFVAAVILLAVILFYTRASWVGLVVAVLAMMVFLLKINYKVVLGVIAAFLIVVACSWTSIMIKLESNRKQSSTELTSHLQSISNISTDASNVERINRWNSAFRMFMERPLVGWGPGTYQFNYAPFQRFDEKTIISTNAGNAGNAHSEYIGPLAEQGLIGMLAFVILSITVIVKGSLLIRHAKSRRIKVLAMGMLLGLITYWVHGMLNNFLDTDKASVPFWGFLAALTALDVYHNQLPEQSGVAAD